MIWLNKKLSLCLLLAKTASANNVEYLQGSCMNQAWQNSGANNELGCSANEVSTSVVSVDGPSSCKEGEFIEVNVTASVWFRATRYDFAIYTSTVPGGDPIFGEECALDVLGPEDAGVITGGTIEEGDRDPCYDVFVNGQGASLDDFRFQENLRIPCLGDDESGETRTVFLQNCFSWRSNGQNEICDVEGAYPGSSSKCDCASLDLGIKIIGPTPAPSISSMPTGMPSLVPSISTEPSLAPSFSPSISTMPSTMPSLTPSISTMPTGMPSFAPSVSTSPTYQPSANPSFSTQPSSQPSTSPTSTGVPSLVLSESPSVSTQPSSMPSEHPSVSAAPSSQPSMSPTSTGVPSMAPSNPPSVSSAPSSQPSEKPSVSTMPSYQPSSAPSISTMPTAEPSFNPSISTMPTGGPSFVPSVSTMPTATPSMSPSISSMPSNHPSESPSITTAPSLEPTLIPSETPSASPTLLSAISGIIFEDMNNNGLMEVDETRLMNIPVRLYDQDGVVVQETLSDGNGHYNFDDVFPGKAHTVGALTGSGYLFSEVVETGNQMTQYDATMGLSPPITLSEGDHRNDVHGGVHQPVQIGNKVWDDLNANGIQDAGEPGIEGIQVTLRDEHGEGLQSTYTDASGLYVFSGMPPGKYGVHFTLPSGYTFTKSEVLIGDITPFSFGENPLDDIDSDADVVTGATGLIDVLSGDINLSLDAGVYRPATVEGLAWHDLNANGIREEDEPPIEGIVIALYNDDNEYVDMGTTDASGSYVIGGLLPDTYYAKFLPAAGDYFLSPTSQGSNGQTDSDFLPESSNSVDAIELQSGVVSSGFFDAGLWMYASVGDFLWYDTNGDGIQDEDPLVGFPFPVIINLYDGINGQLLETTQNDEFGYYSFNDLAPGSYEIEFIVEETEIFSPQFRGSSEEIDSNVNPETGKAQVTLVSGEMNDSVDAGIIGEAPYYPDWVFEEQLCTNDGFDPDWMTTNDGQIYLYRNKEECCHNHFWWRIAQCMSNEEYKFFRNGEKCDTKIDFEDWELNSPADWTDTTLFNTKDECCANLFSYDYSGCMERSPVLFKFEFCIDVGSLLPPIDCQTADIYANVMEDAINQGLGGASDANITRVGDATLTKVDGSTHCGGSLGGQGFINDLTGTTPDLNNVPDVSTSICGVITTESYECVTEDCLIELHDSIISNLNTYINTGDMTNTLQSIATTRLPCQSWQ